MAEQLPKDIIEFDSDTAAQDEKDEASLYPYDPIYSDIEVREEPYTIFEYLRKHNQGRMILQPDFQRNLVWDKEKKSRFIESIILNFPIPPIYINETIEAKYMIIDGLQRTTALLEYYRGDFPLIKLDALKQYNGFRFNELPESIKAKFEDKKQTVFILKPSTPMAVIYDLFNRINTGGTQLNRQEVRNCIFIGTSTKLLKELSEQEYFRNAIDGGIKPTRMKDREAVLRYLSFRWVDYQQFYNGDMSEYVESVMRWLNGLDEGQLDFMRDDFRRVMNWSYYLFGKNSFRIPTETTRGTINVAVLETVCRFISLQTDYFLDLNKTIIRENYNGLITDTKYRNAISQSTGNKVKVYDRFWLAHSILNRYTQ